jgi:tetratricopeptide (TPR) repeat protein
MPQFASASKPSDITDEEMKFIPSYCPDTMGFKYGNWNYNTSPNASRWVALMGKDFWHVHHHCWALINVNRAERAVVPDSQKQAMRENAVANFWYVVNNASSDFILLPEIYTWIGRMEVKLHHPQKASEAFSRAREIKPDYWPAYSHWAEYLIGAGKKSEALKVTIAGLEQVPSSKVLLELLRILGGKPSDIPKPVKKVEQNLQQDGKDAPMEKEAPIVSEKMIESE